MLETGIKLLLKDSNGVLKSLIQDRWYLNRIVEYARGKKTFPNAGCGPLAVYNNTPEGLAQAMEKRASWNATFADMSAVAYYCIYLPSKESAMFFTFDGKIQEETHSCRYGKGTHTRQVDDIVTCCWMPSQTILANMICLTGKELP